MKKKKKSLHVYQTKKESWFGDQFLKFIWAGLSTLAVLGVVGFVAYQGLSRSVFFQIEKVDVSGCRRTSPQEILSFSDLDVQTNLWSIRTGRIRKKLERQDWIARADVSRNWPNRLTIIIRERVPVAIMTVESNLHFVDRSGAVFAEVLPGDDHDFPLITRAGVGTGPGRTTGFDAGGLRDALDFIDYAGNGTAALPRQNISEIHIAAGGDLVLFMADQAFPILLGKENLKTKYYRLSRVLSWLYRKDNYEATAFIDMNYLPPDEEGGGEGPERVLVSFDERKMTS